MRVGGWVRSKLWARTVLGIILATPVLVTAAIGMEALAFLIVAKNTGTGYKRGRPKIAALDLLVS